MLASVLAAGCGTEHETPPPPRPDGVIAYVVEDVAGRTRITVRDLRTGELRTVIRSRGVPQILGWSRDGRQLRYADHLQKRGLDVFLADVKESTQRKVRHYVVDGNLAPSGRLVAVGSEACKYNHGKPLRLLIRLFGPSGRVSSEFAAVDRPVQVSTASVDQWAPDETTLAYEVISWDFSGSCYFNTPETSLYESRVDDLRENTSPTPASSAESTTPPAVTAWRSPGDATKKSMSARSW
jgi:hypothetical protein